MRYLLYSHRIIFSATTALSTLLLLSVAVPLQLVSAQVPATPRVRITQVATAYFPEITVSLTGANLPTAIQELPVELNEDSTPVVPYGDTVESVGIQVALVLDAAGNVKSPGPTGEPQYIEVGRAVREFVKLGLLAADRDWLTTISFKDIGEIGTLVDWTQDHQGAVDSLYVYQPVEGIANTPLYDLLNYSVKLFEDATLPDGQEQIIVIFSDGIDLISSTALSDAVSQASQRNIRIYSVMIGNGGSDERRKLSSLADLTDGKFYELDSVEGLAILWQDLALLQNQRRLTYRTQQSRPGAVSAVVTLPDGKPLESSLSIPPVPLQPVQIVVEMPENNAVIRKFAERYDTPIEAMEPTTQEIRVRISWPDGYIRGLRRMEYELGGVIETRTGDFEEVISLPIPSLGVGNYTLRVRAIDEIGISAESQPIAITVEENRPPAPTPTTDPTLVARAEEAAVVEATSTAEAILAATRAAEANQQIAAAQQQVSKSESTVRALTWTTMGATAFGIAALAYALYILSNRDRRRQATQVITGTVAAMTEPFRPRRGGRQNSEPRAQLSLIDDGGTHGLPPTIGISRLGVRLGRDPSLVDIPLSDRRISKLHCRISEDPTSGGYKLIDEGSTSGTYVNDDEVSINGVSLNPGDIIGIGPVQYRFVILEPPDSNTGTKTEVYRGDGDTEPYIKVAPTSNEVA